MNQDWMTGDVDAVSALASGLEPLRSTIRRAGTSSASKLQWTSYTAYTQHNKLLKTDLSKGSGWRSPWPLLLWLMGLAPGAHGGPPLGGVSGHTSGSPSHSPLGNRFRRLTSAYHDINLHLQQKIMEETVAPWRDQARLLTCSNIG
jgi:hypothetical protein